MGFNEDISDDELVLALNDGSQLAYTAIYARYHSSLYLFAYNRLGNREEAKDIIHELFLWLWENRSSIVLTQNLRVYLYTAVRNKILDLIKHQKVSARYIESLQHFMDTQQSEVEEQLLLADLPEKIELAIQSLPDKMRRVFELSRKVNFTRKEIAQELGLSEQTVKSHIHHALKLLKRKLGPLFSLLFLFQDY